MNQLINTVKETTHQHHDLPFSVYTSFKKQQLLNVPLIKPLLIFVLSGEKKLGANHEITCNAGNFIFLSNRTPINMRNIPKDTEYLAILIEFDYQDFNGIEMNSRNKKTHVTGVMTHL